VKRELEVSHGASEDASAARGVSGGARAAHGMATISEVPATEEG
jgi:hypothetical protein